MVPALEIAVSILGVLAFAAWVPWCEACRRPQPIWPGRTGGILALGAVLILILIVELIAWGL